MALSPTGGRSSSLKRHGDELCRFVRFRVPDVAPLRRGTPGQNSWTKITAIATTPTLKAIVRKPVMPAT
jgi:hypothetical protein